MIAAELARDEWSVILTQRWIQYKEDSVSNYKSQGDEAEFAFQLAFSAWYEDN